MSQDERADDRDIQTLDTKTALTDNAWFPSTHPERTVHTTAKLLHHQTPSRKARYGSYPHEGKAPQASPGTWCTHARTRGFHYRLAMRRVIRFTPAGGERRGLPSVQKGVERPASKIETVPPARAVENSDGEPHSADEKPG